MLHLHLAEIRCHLLAERDQWLCGTDSFLVIRQEHLYCYQVDSDLVDVDMLKVGMAKIFCTLRSQL